MVCPQMVSDMRGADVVMMKTNKKKKKRAKGDTSRDVTGASRVITLSRRGALSLPFARLPQHPTGGAASTR